MVRQGYRKLAYHTSVSSLYIHIQFQVSHVSNYSIDDTLLQQQHIEHYTLENIPQAWNPGKNKKTVQQLFWGVNDVCYAWIESILQLFKKENGKNIKGTGAGLHVGNVITQFMKRVWFEL